MNENKEELAPVQQVKIGRPKEWTDEKIIQVGEEMVDWFNASPDNVFLVQFCAEKGIHTQRISEWTKQIPSFSDAYNKCMLMQHAKLLQKGMDAKNPLFSMFALKNHHGYADKKEVKQETRSINIDVKMLKSADEEELRQLLEAQARGSA